MTVEDVLNQAIQEGKIKLVCSRPEFPDVEVIWVDISAHENNYYGPYLYTSWMLSDNSSVSEDTFEGKRGNFEIKVV